MDVLNSDALAEYLRRHDWLSFRPSLSRYTEWITVTGPVSRYSTEIDYDCFSAVGVAELLLEFSTPPAFSGGLLWILNVFPADRANVMILLQVLKSLGHTGVDHGGMSLSFNREEHSGLFSTLALCFLFGWDCYLMLDGHKLVACADNDRRLSVSIRQDDVDYGRFDALFREAGFQMSE